MELAKNVIFVLLLIGFCLFFQRIKILKIVASVLWHTKQELDDASRQRVLANRRNLILMQQQNSWWYQLEKALVYGGWIRRFPLLTVERWMAGNIVGISILFIVICVLSQQLGLAFIVCFAVLLVEYVVMKVCRIRAFRSVNDNLLKFLDFLGNYSITAGEITGIMHQISRYMEEPLKTVLAECSYEAQTTGDVSLALLTMAEKVEHPMFQEIVKNIEVSVRYCADFKLLVQNSRRSVREFLRSKEERSGMLREALISMVLLTGMSLLALVIVDELIDVSIWQMLGYTIPGRGAIVIIVLVFGLFFKKMSDMNG